MTGKRGANRGEKNGQARLTAKDVGAIRAEWAEVKRLRKLYTLQSVAKKYGISVFQVSQIGNRKAWRHVT